MNAAEQLKEQLVRESRHLAAKTKPVLVKCRSFHGLAYRDVDGKWKSFFYDEELKGEITAAADG